MKSIICCLVPHHRGRGRASPFTASFLCTSIDAISGNSLARHLLYLAKQQ